MSRAKKPALTLDASLVQDDLPLEVVPKIFLGSIHSAFNLDALLSHGITHILNASRIPVTFPKQFTYLSVEIRDKDDANILSCIPTTNIFIEGCLDSGGGILIHCFGGKSRSPAFIAAYIMSSYNWGFDEAYQVIKQIRPAADINYGFECQLRAYAAANYDVYIAQQLLLRTRIRELSTLRLSQQQNKALNIHNSPMTYEDSNSSNDSFILKPKAIRSTQSSTRHKRALSSAQPPSFLEVDTMSTSNYPPSANSLSIGTDHSYGSNSTQGFSVDNNPQHSSMQHGSSMDIDSSHEGEDFELKSPFNSKQTMTTTDTMSTSNSRGVSAQHASTTSNSGSDAMEESHDSLQSLSSNLSLDNITNNLTLQTSSTPPVPFSTSGGDRYIPRAKSHRTSDSISSSHLLLAAVANSNPATGTTSSSSSGIHSVAIVPDATTQSNHHHSSSSSTNSEEMKYLQASNPTAAANANANPTSKYPACRLSRPGSSWVRVIPPLLGLEREFHCSWCNVALFQLANVLRVDIDNMLQMLAQFTHSLSLMTQKTSIGNTVMRRDFDETCGPDELEEAFLSRSSSQALPPSSNDHNANSGTNRVILPPITKKASMVRKGSFGFNSQSFPPPEHTKVQFSHADFASSNSNVPSSGFGIEMDIDQGMPQSSFGMCPPLKTSRANKGKSSGFTFESVSSDDQDATASKAPFARTLSQMPDKEVLSLMPLASPMSIGGGPPSNSSTTSMMSQSLSIPSISRNNSVNPPIQSLLSPNDFSNKIMASPRVLPSINAASNNTSTTNTPMEARIFPSSTSSKSTPNILSPPPQLYDDSPRISIPPHRLAAEHHLSNSRPSSANAIANNKNSYTLFRPKSAEKRRWLARLHLLRSENPTKEEFSLHSQSQKNIKNRVSQVAEADDIASQSYSLDSNEKYFHVEYMDWMGPDILDMSKEYGDICCPGCKHVLGSWSWNPSPRLLREGRLEAPLFRIHKNVVHHMEVDFDATPSSTPRLSEDYNASTGVM